MNRQARRALNTGSRAWAKIRAEVLTRDEYVCKHCGQYGNHVDHIDNNSHNNALSNLQTLCVSCHSVKTAQEQAGGISRPKVRVGADGAPDGW